MKRTKKTIPCGALALGDEIIAEPPQFVTWLRKENGVVSYSIANSRTGPDADFHEVFADESIEIWGK